MANTNKDIGSKDVTTHRPVKNLPIENQIKAVFKEESISGTPNVIVVSGEIAFLNTLIPTIAKAHEDFPNSPIVLCGGTNKRYGTALMETLTVGKLFHKFTGLNRLNMFRPEADIIHDILSSEKEPYVEARKKLGISRISPINLHKAQGNNFFANANAAKEVMTSYKIKSDNILTIGSYHSNRLYLTMQHVFPESSQISWKPYTWQVPAQEGGIIALTPTTIRDIGTTPASTISDRKWLIMAFSVFSGEVQKIQDYRNNLNFNEVKHLYTTAAQIKARENLSGKDR